MELNCFSVINFEESSSRVTGNDLGVLCFVGIIFSNEHDSLGEVVFLIAGRQFVNQTKDV